MSAELVPVEVDVDLLAEEPDDYLFFVEQAPALSWLPSILVVAVGVTTGVVLIFTVGPFTGMAVAFLSVLAAVVLDWHLPSDGWS